MRLLKKFVLVLILYFSIFSIEKVNAITIIHDEEIEDIISKISNPLFSSANLQNVKIYIISSNELNAFSTYNEIYIYSGLMIHLKNWENLAAIIAHEIAHIKEKHIVRRAIIGEKTTIMGGIPILAGIIASLSGADPSIAIAGGIIGSESARKSFLKFSRENEAHADRLAINYMYDSGYNFNSMLNVLNILANNTRSNNIDPYMQTHPIGQTRIEMVRNYIDNRIVKKKYINNNFNKKYERALTKLAAFTSEKKLANFYYSTNDEINHLYAKTILSFKNHEYENALKLVDLLLKYEPNNPYFYEMKGDILINYNKFEQGIFEYKKAINLSPNSFLIRVNYLRALIIFAENNKANLIKFKKDIEENFRKLSNHNNDFYLILFLKARYLALIGDIGEAYFTLAQAENNIGNTEIAERYAKFALDNTNDKNLIKKIKLYFK